MIASLISGHQAREPPLAPLATPRAGQDDGTGMLLDVLKVLGARGDDNPYTAARRKSANL